MNNKSVFEQNVKHKFKYNAGWFDPEACVNCKIHRLGNFSLCGEGAENLKAQMSSPVSMTPACTQNVNSLYIKDVSMLIHHLLPAHRELCVQEGSQV